MKILGIAQRGTESGLTRIRDLVQCDDIEFVYLENFYKHEWESRIPAFEPFDGILSQCVTHIEPEYRNRTVLFGLGSTNRKVLGKASIRDYLKSHPLRDYWVNNNSFRNRLLDIDIPTKVMYRANDVYVPSKCPPGADNKFIIWYASSWNGCLNDHKALSQSIIMKLGEHGVKVFMLPHDKGWVDAPHVTALGKVDLKNFLPIVHGMVRFGAPGDFGRINYDVLSQGRWTLNYDVDEPWMESVDPKANEDQIIEQIMNLIDNDTEEDRVDRWMYAQKHFTREAMSHNWQNSLINAFS
jgi:hypothetical protein